ncbi:hypothetical protein MBANPS3_010613 [Mucor bainieri]
MFSNFVTPLYNRLVVVKSAAPSEYYYDAHQAEHGQKAFQDDLHAAEDQDYVFITAGTTTEESVSDDKVTQGSVVDDLCVVGERTAVGTAASTTPSVTNGFPSSSSASNVVKYANHAASIIARTAIWGAVRCCNFVWYEKKHIEQLVQERAKRISQPKMRGFGVDFANVPGIKFNLAAVSPATAAA